MVPGDVFAVQFWGDTDPFLEQAAEIVDIGNAALLGDRLGGKVRHDQELLCLLDALAVDKIRQGDADFFLEQCGQVAGIDIQPFGHRLQAQVSRQIGVDVGDDLPRQQGVVLERMFADQAAVVEHDAGPDGMALFLLGDLFDELDVLVGAQVNVDGVHAGLLCLLAKQGVEGNRIVLVVAQLVGHSVGH